jgi:hypothetical protein
MVKNAIIGKIVDVLSTKEGTSKKGTQWVLREVLIEDSDGDFFKVPIMNLNIQKGTLICVPFEYKGKELPTTWIIVIQPIGVFSPLKDDNNRVIHNSNKQKGDEDINQLPF